MRSAAVVGKLFDIIQRHMDQQAYGVSERAIARAMGVAPSTIKNWRNPTRLIDKEHLVAIARVTGVPYERVRDALLEDIGYLHPDDPPGKGESGGEERTG